MGVPPNSPSWKVAVRETDDGVHVVREWPQLSRFASALFGYPVTLATDASADEVREETRSRLESPLLDT